MRPTKYSPDMIERVENFTESMNNENFTKKCSIFHVAQELEVCKHTVYNWQGKNKKFLHAIKRWETKRNCVFLEIINDFPQAIWIFLAKNWLKMSDKHEYEHSTPEGRSFDINMQMSKEEAKEKIRELLERNSSV